MNILFSLAGVLRCSVDIKAYGSSIQFDLNSDSEVIHCLTGISGNEEMNYGMNDELEYDLMENNHWSFPEEIKPKIYDGSDSGKQFLSETYAGKWRELYYNSNRNFNNSPPDSFKGTDQSSLVWNGIKSTPDSFKDIDVSYLLLNDIQPPMISNRASDNNDSLYSNNSTFNHSYNRTDSLMSHSDYLSSSPTESNNYDEVNKKDNLGFSWDYSDFRGFYPYYFVDDLFTKASDHQGIESTALEGLSYLNKLKNAKSGNLYTSYDLNDHKSTNRRDILKNNQKEKALSFKNEYFRSKNKGKTEEAVERSLLKDEPQRIVLRISFCPISID